MCTNIVNNNNVPAIVKIAIDNIISDCTSLVEFVVSRVNFVYEKRARTMRFSRSIVPSFALQRFPVRRQNNITPAERVCRHENASRS